MIVFINQHFDACETSIASVDMENKAIMGMNRNKKEKATYEMDVKIYHTCDGQLTLYRFSAEVPKKNMRLRISWDIS